MRNLLTLFIIGCLVSSVAARKKNPFMDPSQDEYKSETSKLIGKWDISSYVRDEEGEQVGSTYSSGTMEIQELPKKNKPGKAIFTFEVTPEKIQGRIEAWNKKKKELTVDKYLIIATSEWRLNKDGDILYLEETSMTVEITGSGKQLKNFQGTEKGFVESASEMKNSGGLNNMIGGMVMKKASGTDVFTPEIPEQTNFEFSDSGMSFKNIYKQKYTFTKK